MLCLTVSLFSEKSQPFLIKFWFESRVSLLLAYFPNLAPELSASVVGPGRLLQPIESEEPPQSGLEQLRQRQLQSQSAGE